MAQNVFAPPQADMQEITLNPAEGLEFFTISKSKLIVMTIMTLGFYTFYWFYKQWQAQKRVRHLNIIPMLRALFYIFYTHLLFKRIHDQSVLKKMTNQFRNYALQATLFVILTIFGYASYAIDITNSIAEAVFLLFIGLLWFVSIITNVKAQIVINQLNDDPNGSANSIYTDANIIWIIIGSIFWLAVIASILILFFGSAFVKT